MQKEIIKKNIYGLLIFAIAVLTISYYFIATNVVTSNFAETLHITEIASLPNKLLIPKINIEANIEQTGITEDGNMGIPEVSTNVAWYKLGAIPGTKGNAVIAGHLDNFLGLPLVFSRLNELVVGDDIYIINEDGNILNFKVTGKELYDYNSFDTEDVFGPTDKKHLNLITCNGIWFQDIKNYNKRLVIFSEAV